MKRIYIFLGILIGIGFTAFSITQALSTFLTVQGGTGTSTPSGILYGDNGATTHLNTVTIGSNLTFSGGTLSASAGSGSPYPFTPTTSWGSLAQSTTSIMAFPQELVSSSTIGKLVVGSLIGTSTVSFPSGSIAIAALASNTIGLTSSGSITIGGSAAALGSSMTADLNLGNANIWTGLQTFGQTYQASSSIGRVNIGSFFATSTASIATTTSTYLLQIGSTNPSSGGLYVNSNAQLGIGTSTISSGLSISNNNFIQNNGQSVTLLASSTTNVSGLYTVDWNNGNDQTIILSGNASIDINATSSHAYNGGYYSLTACQDGSGSRVVTWSSLFPKWLGVTAATTTVPSGANQCIQTIWHYLGSTMLQNYTVASSSAYSRL